jgi:ABC-type multidrug transport system fused ATPase/permease subunit
LFKDQNLFKTGSFSHSDSIYQGIADHVPMCMFIFSYLAVTLGVCFYIQWDVTLVMLLALPVLIGTRMIFSKVSKNSKCKFNLVKVVLQDNGRRIQTTKQDDQSC